MSDDQALQHIHTALEKALDKQVTVNLETDLFNEKILDSLDTMVFFLNLEEVSGVKFPDKDLAAAGFGKVARIVEHLNGA